MFIRQLTYLTALDKRRRFGCAAQSCHVSQPALSNAIRELKRELGITIIKRNRTFEGITPEGERVILWARQMLASLEGLRQEAELVRSVAPCRRNMRERASARTRSPRSMPRMSVWSGCRATRNLPCSRRPGASRQISTFRPFSTNRKALGPDNPQLSSGLVKRLDPTGR